MAGIRPKQGLRSGPWGLGGVAAFRDLEKWPSQGFCDLLGDFLEAAELGIRIHKKSGPLKELPSILHLFVKELGS